MPNKRDSLLEDLRRYVPSAERLSLKLIIGTVFRQPGFLACVLFREMDDRYLNGHVRWAQIVYLVNLRLTGADLLPGARIGPGLLVRHANGIVVGVGAVMGAGCTILQQVTLGVSNADASGEQCYPVVGDRVTLGAGCKLIGSVRIGDDAVVGANSVVTRNVDAGVTVVGAPARPIRTT